MRQGVPIILPSGVKTLRYGINALAMAEDMLGYSVQKLDSDSIGIKELRIMFYCGLRWENKNLSLDDAGDILDEGIDTIGLNELMDKLSTAITEAMPSSKKP